MAQILWKQLVLLTSYDQKLNQFEKKIELHTLQAQELASKHRSLLEHKQSLDKQATSQQLLIRTTERALDEINEKDQRIKTALERCSDQKEYMALTNERKVLEREYQQKEETLLRLWHEYETVKRKQEEANVALKNHELETVTHQGQCPTSFEEFSQEYGSLKEEHSALLKSLPHEWKEQYEAMRFKVADPIVPLHQTSCSACFYPILGHELVVLKRNALMRCKNCYRFLYYDVSDVPKSS